MDTDGGYNCWVIELLKSGSWQLWTPEDGPLCVFKTKKSALSYARQKRSTLALLRGQGIRYRVADAWLDV